MMFGLSDASVLTGLCHKHDGSWHISEVDLDRFIANMWGSFVAGGSAFTRSSRNLRLEFQDEMNALTLSGELSDGKGTWKASQIDLAEYVVVKNGRLTFEKRRVPEAIRSFVRFSLTQKPVSHWQDPAEE